MSKNGHKKSLRREFQELSLLFQISQKLDQSRDLKDVLAPILSAMAEKMGMLRGTIALFNRAKGEVIIEAGYGLSKLQKNRGNYKLGEGITGQVVRTGQAAVIPKIAEEPLFLDKTGARKDISKENVSFICVPIKIGNEAIGVVSADRLFDNKVSFAEDVRLLSIIASLIAQSMSLRRSIQEERERLLDENVRLKQELQERFRPGNIIGNSSPMQDSFDLIGQVCKSTANVLLRGESGTGKELFAHAIHYNSLRRNKPFVKVNCAALSENLIESELFGHEKGAFTSALSERKGRFESAYGGTIFLDEVGDFSPSTQVKLLRVLQEKEFERVGSTETIQTDVRIIAATNRNLEEMIEEGTFREDLYYRLNVFPIHIPPLRDRKTDILLLADYFAEKCSRQVGKNVKRISTPAIDMLMSYHWPGNVRELENCIERAVLLADEDVVYGHHLPPTLQTAEATGTVHAGTLQETLDSIERDLIIDTLKSLRGNMAKASRQLGISERLIGLRVKKYNINYKKYRGRS